MKTVPKNLPTLLLVMTMMVLMAVMASPALASNETLIGAVVKTDAGAALSTNDGEYLTLGKDLSAFSGMTVIVSGDVENGALVNTVRVKEMQVLSPNDLIDPEGSVPSAGSRAKSS